MKYLLVFILAFLSGIFAGSLIIDALWIRLIFVFCFVWILFEKIFVKFNAEHVAKIYLLIFCGFIFGLTRFFISIYVDRIDIGNFDGESVLKGCIIDEVDVRDDKVKYTVLARKINVNGYFVDVDGKILVNGPRYPVYEYGDCLLIKGQIKDPGEFDGFDYGRYLARYDIYGVIYQAKISKIGDWHDGIIFLRWLFGFKEIFLSKMSEFFAEPYSSLMAGLILGSRKGIDEDLITKFNATGLTHIVAISGYNITLLIVVVCGMFGFLSRKRKVFASIFVIVVFVILVGASASVVRAAVMGIIGLLALWFGRDYFVSISLFSAAFFMNLWNPKILVYDVGFQLSFLATCGLVYISPFLEKYFKWLPKFLGIRDSMTMTVSAQILTLPIILLNFGRLSLISPFANIFVLPFIPWAMIFGFLAVIFGSVLKFFGIFVGFFGYLVLGLIIWLVKFFAAIPFATVNIEWFSWWLATVYYFFICILLIKSIDYAA